LRIFDAQWRHAMVSVPFGDEVIRDKVKAQQDHQGN
jgi:hypothetical protein